MQVRALILSFLVVSSAQIVPAQHCGGTERWAVKDGTDPAAQQINFNNITPIQVSDLLSIHQPSIPTNNTTRVVPDETHLYRISARLVKWKKECCQATDDSDYHLVMTDETLQFSDENNGVPVTGHSFVAELPDPGCLSGRNGTFGTSSPFFQSGNPLNVTGARQSLEQQTQSPAFNGSWNEMNGIPVEIIGVGFFDRAHKQTGRSPNNIEIHPVLSISFNPGPGPGPGPGPTPQPTGQNWEYKLITSTTAPDLLNQANDLGGQSWELVSVVVDTTRPDKYVGYLKRKK
ncbi:MAG TPA: hypothetical protein VNX88_03920 [Terriglobales bacterium]|jgi:hypothetical protein|nr:hypothetical protein [Terriglobales bacterium]